MSMLFNDSEDFLRVPRRTTRETGGLKPQPSLVDQLTNQINTGSYQYGAIGDAFRAGDITEAQKDSLASLYYSSPVSRTDTNLQARQETWQGLGRTAPTLDPLEIVNTPSVEQVGMLSTSPDLSKMTWQDLEQQRLAGSNFSLGKDFVASDQAARESDLTDQGLMFEAGLGEDLRQDYNPNNQFTTGAMGEVTRSGQQADFKNLIDQGTVNRLAEQGLQANYAQDKYKGYRYNPDTGAYDYYDNTPSNLETLAPQLIKAGIMGVATAGVGSAIGTATGASGALASGATRALANAAVQQLVTGEIDPVKALVSGIAGAAEAATETANAAAANVENLKSIAESSVAGESLIAQTQLASAVQAATDATSTAEIFNNLQTGINVIEAVEDKNIIKAFDLTASMLDAPTLAESVSTKISDLVPSEYNSAVTSGIIRAGSTIARGGDAGDAIQDGVNEILINTVASEDSIKKSLNLEGEWGDVATKTLASLSQDALRGKNREEIIGGGLETFLKEASELIPESESETNYLKQAEQWWHENVEDPAERWWQEIEPAREIVEQAFDSVVDSVKTVGEQAIEAVDSVVRALPTTKEDWEQAVETTKELAQPAVEAVRETGRSIEEGYDTVEDYIKEEVAPVINQAGRDVREIVEPVTTAVRETGRAVEQVYDTAEDFVKEEVAPAIRETGRGVREAVDPISNAVRETGRTLEEGYDVVEDYVKEEVAPAVRDTGRDIREFFATDGVDTPDINTPDINIPSIDIPSVDLPNVSGSLNGYKRYQDYYYDDTDLVTNPLLSTSSQRIKDLTDYLTQEQKIEKARVAKILADEQERKLRTKPVYGIDPRLTVG